MYQEATCSYWGQSGHLPPLSALSEGITGGGLIDARYADMAEEVGR